MSGKGQHVAPRGDKWSVRTTGSHYASGMFLTQREAIESAKELAKSQGTVLYIHGQDGQIRERRSYSKELMSLQS